MKLSHIYLMIFLAVSLSMSCSKNPIEPEKLEKNKQVVTFSTNGFQQTVTEINPQKSINVSSNDTLMKYAPKLYCQIYKFDDETLTDGFLAFDRTYKRSDSNFGTITAALVPGNYVAIIVASGHQFYRLAGLGGQWPDMLYSNCHFNTMTSVAIPFIPVDQIFYKKVLFTVGGEPLNQEVTLTRMVAGLDVVIKDAIPSNITSIRVIVDDAPFYNFYRDSSGGNVDKISGVNPSNSGTNVISTYVVANGIRAVQIIAYAGEEIVAQKNLSCTFYTNKKTRLEGSLFTTNASFTVAVDPTWETAGPVVNF
ncbi:hypothetical protein [Desertivirga brevis]|uniref:hypothetical protein n=1 Tax=Desertivirga brevis TaxID=2810310 RepID=UPI001A96CEF4|nr:hypothetical protein [Pedobacter sp. SYSU D00873]